MNKQEQIDEIYECIKYNTGSYDDDARSCAEILYNYFGYRKSEWISVEDGLPEKFVDVLCCYPSKDYGCNVEIDYMESDRGYFASQFKYGTPTHWMPLPSPPTEKEN